MEKQFTVEEANTLIPLLTASFDRILAITKTLAATNADISLLLSIWGEALYQPTNPDHHLYTAKLHAKEDAQQAMAAILDALSQRGCVVKDVGNRLVDFYYRAGDEDVFLCWKHGEQEIRYWHDLHTGFAGRRPLSELKTIKVSQNQKPSN